ncbi:hypothetical protein DFJ77DRAFT_448136 [Powellomyces hirtus]|nr:hypothetical protein DFJ77DRAFT_448136 [Powellomyces hirtus]
MRKLALDWLLCFCVFLFVGSGIAYDSPPSMHHNPLQARTRPCFVRRRRRRHRTTTLPLFLKILRFRFRILVLTRVLLQTQCPVPHGREHFQKKKNKTTTTLLAKQGESGWGRLRWDFSICAMRSFVYRIVCVIVCVIVVHPRAGKRVIDTAHCDVLCQLNSKYWGPCVRVYVLSTLRSY